MLFQTSCNRAKDAQRSIAHRMGTATLSHLTLLIAHDVSTMNKLSPREFRHEGGILIEPGFKPKSSVSYFIISTIPYGASGKDFPSREPRDNMEHRQKRD